MRVHEISIEISGRFAFGWLANEERERERETDKKVYYIFKFNELNDECVSHSNDS